MRFWPLTSQITKPLESYSVVLFPIEHSKKEGGMSILNHDDPWDIWLVNIRFGGYIILANFDALKY